MKANYNVRNKTNEKQLVGTIGWEPYQIRGVVYLTDAIKKAEAAGIFEIVDLTEDPIQVIEDTLDVVVPDTLVSEVIRDTP